MGLIHLTDRGFELQIVPPSNPLKALKRGTKQMTKKQSEGSKPSAKPVFARLKPSMSTEEKVQNLLGALKASGIDVKPSEQQVSPQEQPRSMMQRLMDEGMTKEQAARAISDTLM